jgi:hypothetical protein
MTSLRLVFIFAVVALPGLACFPSSEKMKREREQTEADQNKSVLAEKKLERLSQAQVDITAMRSRDQFVAEANRELERVKAAIDPLMLRADLSTEVDQLLRSYEATQSDVNDLSTSRSFSLGEAKQSFRASLVELERSCKNLAHQSG